MRLDVGMPTFQRLQKLKMAIHSVEKAREQILPVEVKLHVFFSSKEEMDKALRESLARPWTVFELLHHPRGFRIVDVWNSYLEGMYANALCYLTDDVEIHPMCLVEAWKALEALSFDGVIGLNVANATDGLPVKAAYGMIGRKFADRFPDRHAFCPDYNCFFPDEELEQFSRSLGRFHFCEEAMLTHHHPSFTGKEPDSCHIHHRQNSLVDRSVRAHRREQGWLWGRDFRLTEGGKSC